MILYVPLQFLASMGLSELFQSGLFTSENGLFFGGGTELLITQIIGVLVIGTFSFIVTFIIMKVMKKTSGIRVNRSEESAGIDAVTFGVEAYTTFE